MSEPRKRATFEEIRDLVLLVAEKGLAALEVEQGGLRIRIEGAHRSPGSPAEAVARESLHVLTSPIVGTFYRAPSPDAVPFAEVGQTVARGNILCIIESMKLMNEIESDVAGEIVEVYPRSGQPVEYGEKLFAIRLAA
jgi:biotin carboxyl carrier protein